MPSVVNLANQIHTDLKELLASIPTSEIHELSLCVVLPSADQYHELFQFITTTHPQLHSLVFDNAPATYERTQYVSGNKIFTLPGSLKRLVFRHFTYPTYDSIAQSAIHHGQSLMCLEIDHCRSAPSIVDLIKGRPLEYLSIHCDPASELWIFDQLFPVISHSRTIHWVSLHSSIVQPTRNQWTRLGSGSMVTTLVWNHQQGPVSHDLSRLLEEDNDCFTNLHQLGVLHGHEPNDYRSRMNIHTLKLFTTQTNSLHMEFQSQTQPFLEPSPPVPNSPSLNIWDTMKDDDWDALEAKTQQQPSPALKRKRKSEVVTESSASSSSEERSVRPRVEVVAATAAAAPAATPAPPAPVDYLKGGFVLYFDVQDWISKRFQPPLPLLPNPKTVTPGRYKPLFQRKKHVGSTEACRRFIEETLKYTLHGREHINFKRLIPAIYYDDMIRPVTPTFPPQANIMSYPLPVFQRFRRPTSVGTAGEGRIGRVELVEYGPSRTQYAMKTLSLRSASKQKGGDTTPRYHHQKHSEEEEDEDEDEHPNPVLHPWTMFLNEFRAYQSLSHLKTMTATMVVDACHVDEVSQELKLVTEFLPSTTYMPLKRLLSLGCAALSESFCIRLAHSIETVMTSVHKSGWIHNDMHLDNWMVHMPTGNVCLIDFALSLRVETESQIRTALGVRVPSSSSSSDTSLKMIAGDGVLFDKFILVFSLFHCRSEMANTILKHLSFGTTLFKTTTLEYKTKKASSEYRYASEIAQRYRFGVLSAYNYYQLLMERAPLSDYPSDRSHPNNKQRLAIMRDIAEKFVFKPACLFECTKATLKGEAVQKVVAATFGPQRPNVPVKYWYTPPRHLQYDGGKLLQDETERAMALPLTTCVASWLTVPLDEDVKMVQESKQQRDPFVEDVTDTTISRRIYKFSLVPESVGTWKDSPMKSPVEHYLVGSKKRTPLGQFVAELKFLDAVRSIKGFEQISTAGLTKDRLHGVVDIYTIPKEYKTMEDYHKELLTPASLRWKDNGQHLVAWKICNLLSSLHSRGIIHGNLTFASSLLIHPETLDCVIKNGRYSCTRWSEDRLLQTTPPHEIVPPFNGIQCDYLLVASEFVRHQYSAAAQHLLAAMPYSRTLSSTEITQLLDEKRLKDHVTKWSHWYYTRMLERQAKQAKMVNDERLNAS